MSTPVDPNAPVQQVGETAWNYLCRLQQYRPPTSGPNQAMAKQWLDTCAPAGMPAPSGFQVL